MINDATAAYRAHVIIYSTAVVELSHQLVRSKLQYVLYYGSDQSANLARIVGKS